MIGATDSQENAAAKGPFEEQYSAATSSTTTELVRNSVNVI